MNSDDLWKLILGGGVTVLGSLLLHQVQLGGRRRRRRRDIKEQLELLALLSDAHPQISERVRRRVESALEQYEPSPDAQRRRRDRWISGVSLPVGISVVLIAVVVGDVSLSAPMLVGAGVVAAGIGIGLDELVSRWLQSRAEDDAVAQVVRGGTAVETDTAQPGSIL